MTNDPEGAKPLLPMDLEREIFEFAAFSHPQGIPRLALVAWRVKAWVEPILYKSLCVTGATVSSVNSTHRRITLDAFNEAIQLKPPSFFHDYVHHLCIALHEAHPRAVLATCDGVVDLALFHSSAESWLLPFLAKMPLARLSTSLDGLFTGSVDFGHPIFSRLTHLDVHDSMGSNDREDWAIGIPQIPHLTHLSFLDTHRPPFIQTVLAGCRLLKALILVYSDIPAYGMEEEGLEYFANDTRSVVVVVQKYLEDWEVGADGGEDYWVKADEFIRKRQSGETKEYLLT
ncbi:hypothetical protein C8R43DRAFT_636449 [Mycena crocata]|nr:hypothetical protein C8R43DRAFT_636449 [Mycena crocata]